MNILIIEDEMPNFNRMKQLLERQFADVSIEGPLISTAQVRQHFLENPQHDLMLADIRLTDGLVFEAFEDLQIAIPVIFTTAYDQFAIRAFKFNSIDYLLKPVDSNELAKAINKVYLSNRQYPRENLSALSVIGTAKYRKRFLCPNKDGFIIVQTSEVSRFSLDSGMVKLYTFKGEHHIVELTMDILESQLDPDMFFRINRQHFIHIDSIQNITNSWNRTLKVKILNYSDEDSIIVSRDKVSAFKKWVNR